MKLQRLLSLTRQAVDDYAMINSGDHIALGISGGKDSLTLLYALAGLRRFYPQSFSLSAITVDLGLGNMDLEPIKALCRQFSVPYEVITTEIGKILFEARNEAHPCSLCAKLRKGAFNQAALSLGCNKIAYAHHRDDLIETMFLSLFYEGRFYAFSPRTDLDRSGLTLIRPLLYVSEAEIKGFSKKYSLPVCKNPCPVDGKTRREFVKNLTAQLNREIPGVKDRIFHAIIQGDIEGWPEKQ
ncbi:MAG TPA: tRNA 2-thiocytidine(32) synthetase TtcA [Candidatus Cottocaccamicrobium excrementipullorum]|nr:tRNA 2-thiocytidine(32) synthetase TtcA [Candidatus Cottocaccamicrobium excrementipullorum]